MQWLAAVYGLIGLAVGSFLNVCIYRIPRHESVVFPRSHCPRCGKPIAFYDNIPLISFVWLGGRCRFCRGRIALQYPAVELLTGAAFYACARGWPLAGPMFVNSLFAAVIIVLMFIDYRHQILPNVLTIPGAAAGILLSPLQHQAFYSDALSFGLAVSLSQAHAERLLPWTGSIAGALLSGGMLLLVALLYQLVRRQQGMGAGDIKMMAMVGAFLGWRLGLLTIFLGSAAGSVIGIFLVICRGRGLQTRLAFGTFLGAASILALFFGLELFRWYTGGAAAAR